jgi:hypothetical protein
MGFLGDLFTSPREREAPGQYKGLISGYDDILKQIQDMQNTEAGVTDISSLKSKFGIGETSQPYNIAKRNLATGKAKSLASTSSRMGSSVANPEALFSGVEGNYASALGTLEEGQANADIGQQDYMANMLDQILRAQNQFNVGKQQNRAGVLGAKGGAIGDYMNSLSGASGFDDIMSLAGTASKFISPFSLGGGKKPT